jgi:hypothetical protein
MARLTRLTAGRYSGALLSAISEGLAMDLGVRAAWAERWRPRLARRAPAEEPLPELSSVMPPSRRPSPAQPADPLPKVRRKPWARAGRAALIGLVAVSGALAVAPIGPEGASPTQGLKAPVNASPELGAAVGSEPVQYEPTGSVERSTIDILFKADAR